MIRNSHITAVFIYILSVCLVCLAELDNWPSVSSQVEIAARAQRDISRYILIDQVTGMGVSLNRLVFDKEGYTPDALEDVGTLLDVGVQTLMVDLYWNEFTQKWQLCPAPFPANSTSTVTEAKNLHWEDREYKCTPSMTVDSLIRTINSYTTSTNTRGKVDFIQLLLHLKSIRIDSPKGNSSTSVKSYISSFQPSGLDFASLNNATLNDTVNSFGSLLFTPTDLSYYRSNTYLSSPKIGFYNDTKDAFPSMDIFLLTEYNRVMASVIANDLVKSQYTYNITDADKNTLFIQGKSVDATIVSLADDDAVTKCNELINDQQNSIKTYNDVSLHEHFRLVIDSNTTSFTNDTFSNFVRCGFSPIMNASSYIIYDEDEEVDHSETSLSSIVNNFIPLSFWSWAESQLIEENQGLNMSDSADNDDADANNDNISGNDEEEDQDISDLNDRLAFKCVVVDSSGWNLADCYSKHPYACQKSDSPNRWYVDDSKKKDYFNSYEDGDCPNGYFFSTPLLSIEMLALMNYIEGHNVSYPVWIDVNDITVPQCFVSGGPYATCPYQETVTKLKLVGLIAPSFIVAVVVLILIFCDKLFRTNPVQTNRKRYWKKAINEYVKKHDYEGVPS